ncbi:MAG TPA: DUF4384 domain-containing protein [Xanthobacteraceae bacterium]|nr:DUF4384 domain-containing protein [Xanthobacteraceae bacterium]
MTTAETPESMTGKARWTVGRTAIAATASVFCAAVLAIAPRLALSPDQPMRFTGFRGGPFSPVSAGRSINSGFFPVAWRLTGVPTWIDPTERGGVLSMSSETPIQLRPNAATARLQPGIYQAEIGIVSSSISAVPALQVLLEVKPPRSGRPELSRRDRSQLGKSIESISCAASVGRWKDYDVLSGFVGSIDNLDRIRQIADAVPGTLLGDIAVIGAGPCAIFRPLGKMLFAAPAPSIDIGPSDVFHEGDVLKIEIQAPDSARYLEAFYLQADGTVRHLTADGGMLPPVHETLVFGDGMNGRSKFTVGAPFGQEMILAMASNDPILGPEVPATQSNTELLNALSNAFRGEAAVAEADRSVTARAKFLSVRGR